MKRYKVTLTEHEREELEQLIGKGKGAARKLLKANSKIGWTDEQISEALEVSISTIERVRAAFVEEGLQAGLERKLPKREYKRKLDGEQEAHRVALVCSPPPEDRGHWTLRLLAQKMVELEYVESIAPETIRQTLKKMNLSHG